MPEPWDLDVAESLWRDAQAVVSELTPTLDEFADGYSSARFEATVTGDDARLLRLAEEARDAAVRGRHIAHLLDVFADGLERQEMPLVRAAAHGLRKVAEIEFMFSNASRDGVQ